MSRIHEALKRAEQETKATSAVEVQAARAGTYLDDVLIDSPNGEAIDSVKRVAVDRRQEELGANAKWMETLAAREWKTDPKRLLFADPSRHYEPGMEEFRTLRSRLYQLREKMQLKRIMVASALPGEGKTFVSSNLAYALVRQHGRRVLVIDADVRKCHMHECFGTTNFPGLNEYLAGDATEEAIVQRGPLDNLFFIPGGRAAENPSELIGNGRFELLLDRLSPMFHWVIIDSPPVVPISDGTVIAKHTDGLLLVVQAGSTPVEMVQRAKQELIHRPLLGVVLNRGERSDGYSSYYYNYGAKSQE